ncbi:hypothetical protein C8F04DRAFT_169158 [Mycena alexandri]|uniref:Uncharacterized protein n=1 Tax=Mycena alexandri TaxID=1745969 RepID=A0AAD6SAF6_9AGAR|nr:hypothetical protein C8F04DRAFT_169158 [Mycena alexandri]
MLGFLLVDGGDSSPLRADHPLLRRRASGLKPSRPLPSLHPSLQSRLPRSRLHRHQTACLLHTTGSWSSLCFLRLTDVPTLYHPATRCCTPSAFKDCVSVSFVTDSPCSASTHSLPRVSAYPLAPARACSPPSYSAQTFFSARCEPGGDPPLLPTMGWAEAMATAIMCMSTARAPVFAAPAIPKIDICSLVSIPELACPSAP